MWKIHNKINQKHNKMLQENETTQNLNRSLNYRDGVIGALNAKSDSQLRLRSLLQVDENRTPESF